MRCVIISDRAATCKEFLRDGGSQRGYPVVADRAKRGAQTSTQARNKKFVRRGPTCVGHLVRTVRLETFPDARSDLATSRGRTATHRMTPYIGSARLPPCDSARFHEETFAGVSSRRRRRGPRVFGVRANDFARANAVARPVSFRRRPEPASGRSGPSSLLAKRKPGPSSLGTAVGESARHGSLLLRFLRLVAEAMRHKRAAHRRVDRTILPASRHSSPGVEIS
jgi:hypothetical protein